ANRAHVVMLHECGIISAENATALLNALSAVDEAGLENLTYSSGVEDLFFTIESNLIEQVGTAFGGNLQLARSRNDLGYALTRLTLRPLLLSVAEYLLAFREALLNFAGDHLETIMPGYTHTQPAQPTTMAHYIAGILGSLERDYRRVKFAYNTNNQSPLGAAAFTGTGFPIDRALSARLLGFDSVIPSTYDSIAASDNLTDVAAAVTSLAVNLSRFTRDMLFWATQESAAIRIDDSFIQISSIMPQKRNPVVLEHIRARISRMMSMANGVVVQCHNIPFGDTQDIEDEIFPMLFGALETTADVLHLYAPVISTLQVNEEHLRQRATAGFTTVTELADTLVREAGLPFRQAHSIVSSMVTHAMEHQLSPHQLDGALLAQISEQVTGSRVTLHDAIIATALDPVSFVQKRQTPGGSAPEATATVIQGYWEAIATDRAWLDGARFRLDDAENGLAKAMQKIVEGE
ncbi:MAG: argininosuccinate lyase, partial [Chloroflexota bacterium]